MTSPIQTAGASETSSCRTALVPHRRVGLRLGVLAGLVLFLLLGSPSVLNLLAFALVSGLILGSFPRVYVSSAGIEHELVVLFVTVRVSCQPWSDFEMIETDVEEHEPAWLGFFIGFGALLWCWALDHLFPWFTGDFKLWLRAFAGTRVLAWQGDGESRFRENLDILESQSGLPVTRR